jgi:Domain of unknown function (DUF5664)
MMWAIAAGALPMSDWNDEHCSKCAKYYEDCNCMSEAKKYDEHKPDLSLVPRELMDAAARAFMFGAQKYGRYNYKLGGFEWHRLIAAALRHITAYNEGEDKDPESGLSHLDHAAATIGMLLVYVKGNLGTDTRYKRKKV